MVEAGEDRYVSLDAAIAAVRKEEDFPEGSVEKFELVCHASGDVTWRAWTRGPKSPWGGTFHLLLQTRHADLHVALQEG